MNNILIIEDDTHINQMLDDLLSHLDSISNLRALVDIQELPITDLVQILGSSLAMIMLCGFLGRTWLRKAENK